jgi:hypothetical protein
MVYSISAESVQTIIELYEIYLGKWLLGHPVKPHVLIRFIIIWSSMQKNIDGETTDLKITKSKYQDFNETTCTEKLIK